MSEPIFLTSDMPFDLRLNRLKEIINKSNKITFFGGAGVSTASGIPDFRSKNGFYNNPPKEYANFSPEFLLSHDCLIKQPTIFFDFIRKYMDFRSYEPNAVHKYLYKLEIKGKLQGLVTQNVDDLHEKAGSNKIYNIHGTLSTGHCMKCNKKYNSDVIYNNVNSIPYCECGGIIRPDIVLYNEKLPQKDYEKAYTSIITSDCLIVAGTSLTVYPAAGLVSEFNGEYLIILNYSSTNYDNWADVVFKENMNEVFQKLLEE